MIGADFIALIIVIAVFFCSLGASAYKGIFPYMLIIS